METREELLTTLESVKSELSVAVDKDDIYRLYERKERIEAKLQSFSLDFLLRPGYLR